MIRVRDLLSLLSDAVLTGSDERTVSSVEAFRSTGISADAMTWCSLKNIAQLSSMNSGTVICPVLPAGFAPNKNVSYIQVSQPRLAFSLVLKKHFARQRPAHFISTTAVIHVSVKLGKEIFIGNHVTLEEGCVVGDGTSVGHNTVLHAGTQLGKHVKIGANCTIGGTGFGYEKNDSGAWEEIPHIGNVVIHDFAEVGNNTAIDRAVLGSTVIGEHVKIDNLVHIAHGVQIGKNSLIIAHAMIGGSTTIGENVWVSPNASLINKISIGSNALIGMGAVVIRNVEAGDVVAGNPGKVLPRKGDS